MARSGATVFVMGDGELYFCGKNTKANLFGCGAGGAGTKIPVPTRSVDRPPFNVERAAVFDDGNTGLCMASGALWSRGSGVLEALGLGRFDTKESGFASRTDDWQPNQGTSRTPQGPAMAVSRAETNPSRPRWLDFDDADDWVFGIEEEVDPFLGEIIADDYVPGPSEPLLAVDYSDIWGD